MRKINLFSSRIAMFIATALLSNAQDPRATIQQKLQSTYKLTQPTADYTDIVTAGSVLVIKKNNLLTSAVTGKDVYQNTYKDGQISQNLLGKGTVVAKKIWYPGKSHDKEPDTRSFVPSEKLWVTGIAVKDDAIVFNLFTDPYKDVRYRAALKFPFPKDALPSVDQAQKIVAEVFDIQPPDEPKASEQQTKEVIKPADPPVASPQVETPFAAIPPPPPPPDQAAPTVAVGQTPDQVIAILGQPGKIVKLSTKQMYLYPDLKTKVTFVNGKVSDIQ